MKEHAINSLNSFVCGWYLDDKDLMVCDELVKYHEISEDKVDGRTAAGLDKTKKNSKDLILGEGGLQNSYFKLLQAVTTKYIEKYPYCNNGGSWRVMEDVLIQHYEPKGGYYSWHTERSNSDYPSTLRHLVFMTYLNDVTDDGETEFFHQGIKVAPEKGLTLVWGSDWTFTHRGIPSPTQDKYIITGWFNFI